MTKQAGVRSTEIPGVLVVDLAVHGDARRWLEENWQRRKMTAIGVPDFDPVQHSSALHEKAGATAGFHAEPWDKLVSVTSGRAFAACVDLRPGEGFGRKVTEEFGPEAAVYIPRGVAHGFQALEDGTTYSYLVGRHRRSDALNARRRVNLADPSLGVRWPIPLESSTPSGAHRNHPALADPKPEAPPRTVVLGRTGQLGRALHALLPHAEVLGRDKVDLASVDSVHGFPWSGVGTIINAAAYVAADAAETPAGRRQAWAVNAAGVAALSQVALEHGAVFVHVSSDYVFDGTIEVHHEDEPFSPLGVYGQTKAAGDLLAAQVPRHYVVRPSWVIGDGHNFVRTMARFAEQGRAPAVVDDQVGRLTFAEDLAAGIVHLLATGAPYGTYNLSNEGPAQSWWEIASDVFELCGRSRYDVRPVSTREYAAGRQFAPRPPMSSLSLEKLAGVGFTPALAADRLRSYVESLHVLAHPQGLTA